MTPYQTRYRMISRDQVVKCYRPEYRDTLTVNDWHQFYKGKPVAISLQTVANPNWFICDGPFFLTTSKSPADKQIVVCAHIIEVGD